MKIIQSIFGVAVLAALVFTSCKKTAEKELEREKDRITGTWTVSEIRYVLTDTLGKTIADSTVANAGTMEFQQASEVGSDVFHPVLFSGACAGSELVNYFRGQSAGDPVTGGGWSLYWDADPASERMIIWGIGPSSSYHRVMNLDGSGDERTMWYMLPQTTAGRRAFYYFELEK